MPKIVMFTHTLYIGITLEYIYMNLWLELDNRLTVAQLVRALHRNRRAVDWIPARGPIVAFVATASD